MWQLGDSRISTTPIVRFKCHKKRVGDVAFVMGSSVVMTAGLSSSRDRKNVCAWDTLAPPKTALVWGARDVHTGGSRSLVISRRHNVVVSGGEDGDLVVHDLRQRAVIRTLQDAHDQESVRCLALSPCENYVASAANDGSLKIWDRSLMTTSNDSSLTPRYVWSNLHGTKTDMFSSSGELMTQHGITDLVWTPNGLFTSGADGYLRVIKTGFS